MKRMNLICGVAAAALVMTVAQAACAQDAPSPPPPPGPAYPSGPSVAAPGFHQHDGFFFRTTVGLGSGRNEGEGGGQKLTFSSPGLQLGVAFGGAISPNVVIFGEFDSFSMEGPDVVVNGEKLGTSASTFSVWNVGVGPGVAYYFNPSNVLLSGSLLATSLSFENEGITNETETGVGFSLKAGKEWWVSHGWGLGVVVGALISTAKLKENLFGAGATWKSQALHVSFSASFN